MKLIELTKDTEWDEKIFINPTHVIYFTEVRDSDYYNKIQCTEIGLVGGFVVEVKEDSEYVSLWMQDGVG